MRSGRIDLNACKVIDSNIRAGIKAKTGIHFFTSRSGGSAHRQVLWYCRLFGGVGVARFMTLDTTYPQPEGLRVDHAQRFSDFSADRALAGRYSRLSVLLVASLALHLSLLTVLDLS